MLIDTSAIPNFDTMTDAEKAALVGITLPEPIDMSKYVSKDTFDKKASEAAELSKRLKAAPDTTQLNAEIADLKKTIQIQSWTEKYRNMGYAADLAAETAKAVVDGDMETVFANGEKYQKSLEEKWKAEAMKSAALDGTVGTKKGNVNAAEEQAKKIGKAKSVANKNSEDVMKYYIK